jgi:L,D-peptidoglycan transpeptidase YkuD (ErfK/YbiS/YcfS/YnhG family)
MFSIGTAFGYADSANSQWPYAAMNTNDYCIDVDGIAVYNRIVDAEQGRRCRGCGSTEPMRRDLHSGGDPAYKLGFVIEHNPRGTAPRAAASSRTCGSRLIRRPPVAPRWPSR